MILVWKTSRDKGQTAKIIVIDTGPFHEECLLCFLEIEIGNGGFSLVGVTHIYTGPRILDIEQIVAFKVLPIISAVPVAVSIVGGGVETDAGSPIDEENSQISVSPSGTGIRTSFSKSSKTMPPRSEAA